jgi:hypothetical protein
MNKYLNDKNNLIIRLKNKKLYNLSEKIIIFDTYCGLCNQIWDINYGINFCLTNNIKFTFRYSTFRNADECSWYNVNFDEIFDRSFLTQFDLYVDYNSLNINSSNTHNYDSKIITNNILYYNLINNKCYIHEPYIVLRGIGVLMLTNNINIVKHLYSEILPSKHIMNIYTNISNELKLNNNEYNFLHYRYESDFIKYFKINTESLENILNNIKFKNNNNKIYIASTNIKNLVKNINTNNLLYKNESELTNLNYEQRAFIDFMIGKNSAEIYGHSKSSFSQVLNILKNTNNYY